MARTKLHPVHTDADLALLVEHRLECAFADGHPPAVSIAAWKRACREQELAMERRSPGFIALAAAGLRGVKTGRKPTGCREVRGTHSLSHVYDPAGTDKPPAGWSLDIAKKIEASRAAT